MGETRQAGSCWACRVAGPRRTFSAHLPITAQAAGPTPGPGRHVSVHETQNRSCGCRLVEEAGSLAGLEGSYRLVGMQQGLLECPVGTDGPAGTGHQGPGCLQPGRNEPRAGSTGGLPCLPAARRGVAGAFPGVPLSAGQGLPGPLILLGAHLQECKSIWLAALWQVSGTPGSRSHSHLMEGGSPGSLVVAADHGLRHRKCDTRLLDDRTYRRGGRWA